jgi:hypothetical protein
MPAAWAGSPETLITGAEQDKEGKQFEKGVQEGDEQGYHGRFALALFKRSELAHFFRSVPKIWQSEEGVAEKVPGVAPWHSVP